MGDIVVLDGLSRTVTSNLDIIYETDEPIVIESLEWGTRNYENIQPRLYPYGTSLSSGYNNLFVTIAGSIRGFCTPRDIGERGSGYFYKRSFNTADNFYSFSLKKPISLPAGGHLGWIGTRDYQEDDTVRYHIIIREL